MMMNGEMCNKAEKYSNITKSHSTYSKLKPIRNQKIHSVHLQTNRMMMMMCFD